jgi:hypothetical protein
MERLSIVDLLIRVACFVKKYKNFAISIATYLNQFVQGVQLYLSFPFSKYSFALGVCVRKAFLVKSNFSKCPLKGRLMGSYSQHFIFLLTHKWAEYAKVFVTGIHCSIL